MATHLVSKLVISFKLEKVLQVQVQFFIIVSLQSEEKLSSSTNCIKAVIQKLK